MERLFYGSALCGETDVMYYLLVEENGTSAREYGLALDWNPGEYGVLVEKGEERTEIPALDSSRERVSGLLDRMVRGVVTPVSARDVAEDWLAS